MNYCARSGCAKPAKQKYCSQECYYNRSVPILDIQPGNKFDRISPEMRRYIENNLGEDGEIILEAMNELLLENPSIPIPARIGGGRTWGDWDIGIPYSGRDYRPIDALDYEKVEWMEDIGVVTFIRNMKLAPAIGVFRDKNGWKFQSPDTELADISTAAVRSLLPRFAMDFGATTMAYGHAPFEKCFEYKSKYELGLSNSRSATTPFIVPRLPNAIKPSMVKFINRETGTGKFDGFTIAQANKPDGVRLDRSEALFMTYQQKYRNLWGNSFYIPIYPLAAWYEIIMRCMLRYAERMASPVTVGKGPSNRDVTIPVKGGKKQVSGMEAALIAASQAAFSSAIVIPSDVDPETNEALFDVFYLETKGNIDIFIKALEHIEQDMFRSGNAADRALTQQSGGVGSYSIGDVHRDFTMVHSDMILTEWVWALNQYWVPDISLYNRGVSGPPLWLDVLILDPKRKDVFDSLANNAGDSQTYLDMLETVDWQDLAVSSGIPMNSEEAKDELLKKIKKRQPKPAPPPSPAVDSASTDNKEADLANKVGQEILNGNIPLVLSNVEWKNLKKVAIVEE